VNRYLPLKIEDEDDDEDDYEKLSWPEQFSCNRSPSCSPSKGTNNCFPRENIMNALGPFQDFHEFRALLHFSEDASEEVFGRMLEEFSAEADARLKALAGGKLSPKERNYLLEELVGNPELLSRLAEHLREQLSDKHL
jgi:hypothetical protein